MQWLSRVYLTFIFLFLYVPIAVVILFSFNQSEHSLLWHGFSLHWFQVLFHDTDLGVVAFHSVALGVIASSVATVLGLMAAVALFRYRFLGKGLVQLLLFSLIILPDLVFGVALLLLFSVSHFPLGFWSLLVAHITFCLPFACIVISNQLRQLDKYMLEAGQDLGASEWQLYKDIIIPLVLPSLIASWLLSFTMSFDDVIISFFVSGPTFEILPLRIYSMVRLGVSPEINALSTIILAITFTLTLIAQRKLRRV